MHLFSQILLSHNPFFYFFIIIFLNSFKVFVSLVSFVPLYFGISLSSFRSLCCVKLSEMSGRIVVNTIRNIPNELFQTLSETFPTYCVESIIVRNIPSTVSNIVRNIPNVLCQTLSEIFQTVLKEKKGRRKWG